MIILDIPSLAALLAVVLLAWAVMRGRRTNAQRLLSLDLFVDVAERRDAAADLGLSPKAQERLLRRYYGAASWKLIRAAEARQWSRGLAADPAEPQSDRGPDRD